MWTSARFACARFGSARRENAIASDAEPARGPHVDTIMIRDPDGISIAFSMPKDDALLR